MTKSEAGSMGGQVTASRHDMREIGKMGGRPTFWEVLERAKSRKKCYGQTRLAREQRKSP